MKILLDVNIFMDVFRSRPGWVDSFAVVQLCQEKKIEGYISALTIPILYFQQRKPLGENKARNDTSRITDGIQVVPLTKEIIQDAIQSHAPDFEDNIQLFSANEVDADYLITRNKKHFVQNKIRVASPDEFLKTASLA